MKVTRQRSKEFKEQLLKKSDGSYQARLPWKKGHDFLPGNKSGSLLRLHSQLLKLKQVSDHFRRVPQHHSRATIIWYSTICPRQTWWQNNLLHVTQSCHQNCCWNNKDASVFDASAKESNNHPSLNAFLHTGSATQPLLQDILIRNCLKPVVLLDDLKQISLKIGINKEYRYVLRLS